MSITVYTKPQCVQCDATIKALDKAGLGYELIDITTDDSARDYIMALGYLQAPVVVAGEDHWGGFRPDRCKALATTNRSPERTQFLVDVLSIAVETGVSYWGDTIHVEDQNGITPEGDNLGPFGSEGNCHTAIVRDFKTGDEHPVTLDTIARGAHLLAASGLDAEPVNDFREANRTNGEQGDIDDINADMALQMGIFGAVIYS